MQKLNSESKNIVEENISVADDAHWRGTNQGSQLAGNAALWDNGDLENDPEFGSSDFNTHPGGLRSSDNGLFTRIGYQGYLWLANISYEYEYTWNRKLIYNNKQIGRQYFYMRDGFLVRCVRD